MLNNSLSKSEKSPWKGARRCLYVSMLSLMLGVLMICSWFSLSWCPSVDWMKGLSLTYNGGNKTTTVKTISPSHHTSSKCFVEYPYQYSFIVDEANRCRQEDPFLVVMIPVAPQNKKARDIIRSTWGRDDRVLDQLVTYYFLLGVSRIPNEPDPPDEQILHESREHHDILQSNFLDSYKNLTIKTMVMLEWLTSHCPNTSYAMKIDSDTFLNVHTLVSLLLKAPRHDYMTGLVVKGAQVLRDPNSKWFLPDDAFPESSYPPYALGLGYVLSLDLTKRILDASKFVKAVYIEDVYVGLCMRHAGVSFTDPPHQGLFRVDRPHELDACYLASVVATLLQDSEQILDVWKVYTTQPQSDC